MRPLPPFPSLRVYRLLLAVSFLTLLGTANAADPVEELQFFLRVRPNFGDKDWASVYQKNLYHQFKAIQRPSDLRRTLLLPELGGANAPQQLGEPADEENRLGKIHQNFRADVAKRLQDVLRTGLRAKNAARRLAAITFLALMADDESRQQSLGMGGPGGPGGPAEPIRFTPRMAADLLEVLANNDEEPRVRAAAAGAVVAIDPGPEKTLEALQGLLRPERDVVERRAAA